MWVLTAPFDGDESTLQPKTKQKLLRPGKTYVLGRKDAPLLIKHSKISAKHIEFTVKEYSEENVTDPEFRPKLFARNFTKKARLLHRVDYEDTTINSEMTQEMFHGDVVDVVTGVELKVEWIPVCCYCSPEQRGPAISLRECASLGISLIYTPHSAVTHHLTATFTLTAPIASSLLSVATLVKPAWLTTLLEAGDSLETKFALPEPTKFRPTWGATLPASLRKFTVWEPNEERVNLFRDRRFIFVGEKGREVQEAIRELVRRGNGEYECFAVEGGKTNWHNVLAKGRAKGKELSLIAEEVAMTAAIGADQWKELVDEAASFNLRFIPSSKCVEAAVYVDNSYISSSLAEATEAENAPSSPLPDIVPNTHPDEPSIPPELPSLPNHTEPPRRKLVRRAASRSVSRAPPSPPPGQSVNITDAGDKKEEEGDKKEEAPKPVRRPLTRRAGLPRTPLIGIDDPIIDVDSGSVPAGESGHTGAQTSSTSTYTAATPARPRLKRRVGTNQPTSQLLPIVEDFHVSPTQERPLKKFKALFEQSDPDKFAQSSLEEYKMSQFQSLEQSETQSDSGETQHKIPKVVQLSVVQEEEEESTGPLTVVPNQPTQSQGVKRKARDRDDDGDVEMELAESEMPKAKKRATADIKAVVPSEPASKPASKVASKPASKAVLKPASKAASKLGSKSQAVNGSAQHDEPDKDEAFLKALATKKRGKKVDDSFDREFNNLRISKPELEQQQDAQRADWAVLADFGDDSDLRGNFMVVVEMDVVPREGAHGAVRRGEARLEWEGRPDFKKFKKKFNGERRKPVALHVEQEPDFGVGSQYWKGSSQPHVAPRSQSHVGSSQTMRSGSKPASQVKSKSRAQTVVKSDEDEAGEIAPMPVKRTTRAASRGTTPVVDSSRATRSPRRTQTQTQTQSTTRGKKAQPLFLDDDEDDVEQGEGGFDSDFVEDDVSDEVGKRKVGARRTRAGSVKPKATKIFDDDSDGGVTFKGFGSRRK